MRFPTSSHFTRHLRARVVVATALTLTSLLTGCMVFAGPPTDLDYSRTRASEGGPYRATIRPQGEAIPQGRMHSWTLHLETTAGAPVEQASVSADGGMPQHAHGLPTKPRVTAQRESGDLLVQGMKFDVGCWWVVKFRVHAAAGDDSLVFNLKR